MKDKIYNGLLLGILVVVLIGIIMMRNEKKRLVDENTALLTFTHVNNESGSILPLSDIVAIRNKKNRNTKIHLDCVQSLGKLPIALSRMGVDMASTGEVACIGDNCIDSYDETGKYYPGGNAVNVAVYLRRMGVESSYVGAVGNDENGERLRRVLLEKGVDVSRLRVIDGPTAVSHVRMLDGDRVFGAYEEGVMADFRPTQEDVEFLCIHDLAAATLWGHAESILPELHRRGIPTAFDASESPLCETARIALPHTSLFFFSDSNSEDDALRDKLRALRSMGPELVIATRETATLPASWLPGFRVSPSRSA